MKIKEHLLLCKPLEELIPLIQSITRDQIMVKPAKARHALALKLTNEQNYHHYVLWYVHNLVSAFERLENVTKYIGDFPKPKSFLKQKITQYDWIQYHYHVYIISIVSLYDIALKLTNAVFRLGLNEREAKVTTVEENLWVISAGVSKSLQSLRTMTARYSKARHLFIHEGDLVKLDELDEVEIFCMAYKRGITVPYSVNVFKTESKPIVDDLLNQMSKEINTLESKVIHLLDELLPIYNFWSSYLKAKTQK